MPNKKQYHGTDMNGYQLTGLQTPTIQDTTDAATVQFVLENAGGAPLAANVSIADQDENFQSENVEGALQELFTFANNGKTTIATAIGSPATSSDTFAELAANITTAKDALDAFIDSAEGTTTGSETLAQLTDKLDEVRVFNKRMKLRKAAASTETVLLNKTVNSEQFSLNVLRLNGDSIISPSVFTADFNNGDDEDFLTNTNVSFTNNYVEIPIITNQSLYSDVSGLSNVKEASLKIDTSSTGEVITDVKLTYVTSTSISYNTIVKEQIIIAKDDIPITNVGDFQRIRLYTSASSTSTPSPSWDNNGLITGVGYVVKYALSFNGGTTWYGWDSTTSNFTEVVLDTVSSNSIANKGLFLNTFNVNPISQDLAGKIDTLRNGSNTLRFAYWMNRRKIDYSVYIDRIEFDGYLKGTFEPANTAATVSFNTATKTVTVTFNVQDTYQINWFDTN